MNARGTSCRYYVCEREQRRQIYMYIYIRTSCNTERERERGGRTRKKEMAGNGERKASGWNTEWPPSVSIQAFTRHPPLHPPLLASLFQLLVCSSFSLCSHRQRWCINAKKKGKKEKKKGIFMNVKIARLLITKLRL